jgi:putative transposase
MARKPRLHIPGGFYHVMLRGNGGQQIFFSDDDKAYFENLIQKGVNRYEHRIHAYCWMNNHVHLAIQVGKVPLSKIMQNLSFRYTRWMNKREGRIGHLFQGRYKAIMIDADSYSLELVRYIHLNPVRAGLVSAPGDYPWSGHLAYLGKQTKTWLTVDFVLSQFTRHQGTARKRYGEFVMEGLGEGHRQEFHIGRGGDGRLLGDDRFIEEVLGLQEQLPDRKLNLEEIIDVVCKEYKVSRGEISSLSRSRRLSEIRTVTAYLLIESGKETLTEFAGYMNRDVATLSNAVRGFRIRLGRDKELKEKIGGLLGKVRAGGDNRKNTKTKKQKPDPRPYIRAD